MSRTSTPCSRSVMSITSPSPPTSRRQGWFSDTSRSCRASKSHLQRRFFYSKSRLASILSSVRLSCHHSLRWSVSRRTVPRCPASSATRARQTNEPARAENVSASTGGPSGCAWPSASTLPFLNVPGSHRASFGKPLRRRSDTSSRAELDSSYAVSYTHLRAHETRHDLVCRLLLEKKKKK